MAKMTRNQARKRKHLRTKGQIFGTAEKPRINVYKSLKNIEVQLIDDANGKTLAHSSSLSLKLPYGGNIEAAKKVGEDFGAKVKALKIDTASFDRGGFVYHGRVKALAEAIREKGVKF